MGRISKKLKKKEIINETSRSEHVKVQKLLKTMLLIWKRRAKRLMERIFLHSFLTIQN